MPRRRTKLPPECPYCGVRPRPKFQSMCQPCSVRHRVVANKDELAMLDWVEFHIGRQLDPVTSAILATAVARLHQRKILTPQERIELGVVLWGYGDALDRIGAEVPACDSMYRKLMGHARTPTCARIRPVPQLQGLHVAR